LATVLVSTYNAFFVLMSLYNPLLKSLDLILNYQVIITVRLCNWWKRVRGLKTEYKAKV